MSYTRRMFWHAPGVDDTSATGDHTDLFIAAQRCRVHSVGAVVVGTTETNGASTTQVDLTANSSTGGTRGAADAGSIVVPDNLDVAEAVVDTTSTIFPFTMERAEFLTFEVSSGSTSGSVHYFVEYEPLQDTVVNDGTGLVTESG